MTNWQPIATAPRDGRSILVCSNRIMDWMQVVAWDDETSAKHDGYGWIIDDSSCSYGDGNFTHWMLLPDPPPP